MQCGTQRLRLPEEGATPVMVGVVPAVATVPVLAVVRLRLL